MMSTGCGHQYKYTVTLDGRGAARKGYHYRGAWSVEIREMMFSACYFTLIFHQFRSTKCVLVSPSNDAV
jgi:hypothetical protein